MSSPKLARVTIDGVDVSSYLMSFSVEEEFEKSFKVASIGLRKTVSEVINFNDNSLINTDVTIQRGVSLSTETYLFRGTVSKSKFEGGFVLVDCVDKLDKTKTVTVNKSFDINIDSEAGVISEIFKTLVAEVPGLTADATSVQDSGTVFVLKKFVLRRATVFDALQRLAETLDWQFYYNPNTDLVYFEPRGFTNNSTVLTVGTNVVNVPKWEIDSDNMFNKIIVKGVQQEVQTEEGPYILDGVAQTDWTTTSITLDNKPVNVRLFSDTSNPPTTEKSAGIEGSTASYDYTVDRETSKITWSDTFTPTTSYYVLVNYSYMIPSPVVRKNNASIAEFGETIEKSVYKDELQFVDDIANWAQKQVDTFGFPFYSAGLRVKDETSIVIGQSYQVVDGVNDINGTFLIKKLKQTFPYKGDELVVSDAEVRQSSWTSDTYQRLKRLEEKQADNEDVLNQFIDMEATIGVRSVFDLYTASPDSGVLYWDDDNQGDWGGASTLTDVLFYWKFDETSGFVASEEVSSNNLTLNASNMWTASGKINYGIDFDGSHYGFSSSSVGITGSSSRSFGGWVYVQSWVHDDVVMNWGNFSLNDFCAISTVVQGGINRFNFWGYGADVSTGNGVSYNTGEWYHICVTFNGTTLIWYINGSAVNTGTPTLTTANTSFKVGSRTGTSQAIDAIIDEVFIFDRVLTPTEVNSLYNGGSGDQYPFSSSGFNWGDDDQETSTLSQRIHTNNIYFEDFWDDDLTDTGNTTCTVDTTNHQLDFTTGETFRSSEIFKYKTTNITTARLSIPSGQITGSSNLSFYMSADGGSNWESVTLGSKKTFTNTGTELRYRIDASDTSRISFVNSLGKSVPLKIEVNI